MTTASKIAVLLTLGLVGLPVPFTRAQTADLTPDLIRCRLDPTCPQPWFQSLPFGNRGVSVGPPVEDLWNTMSFHATFAHSSAEMQTDPLITPEALNAALSSSNTRPIRFVIGTALIIFLLWAALRK